MSERSAVVLMLLVMLAPRTVTGQDLGPICVHSDPSPTRRSSDDVRHAGAIRVSDLFRVMPEWYTTSTEMYLWDVAPGIYALPEWNGMTVLLDGQPLTASFLGTSYLNAFPVDVSVIDSIEVFEGPVLCDGVFAPSGLIHIRTRLEKPVASAGASGGVGNETGEPGPYRFTPHRLPNVDRSGPVGSAFAAIAAKDLHARIAATTDEHHVTDPLLRPRVERIYKSYPPPRHFVFGRRADVLSRHPSRSFSVSVEQTEYDHFRYMPSFGSEWPLLVDWLRVGGHGHARVWRGAALYVSGESSRIATGAHQHAPLHDVGWDFDREQINAGLVVRFALGHAALGVGAYRSRLRTEDPPLRRSVSGDSWHLSSSVAISPHVTIQAFGQLARERGRPLRSGSITGVWTPFRQHQARVTLTGVQQPPHDVVPFLYWASEGLETSVIRGLVPEVQVSRRPATRYTATAAWRWTHPMFAVSLSGTTARFSRFPLAQHAYRFVAEEDRYMNDLRYFIAETALHPATSGRVNRLAAEAEVRPFRVLKARVYYARTAADSDDEAFDASWGRVPRHRAYGSITYAPHNRASVHARLTWESWSTWSEYASITAESDSLYVHRLPVQALLDLGVTKRFWDDHLDASLLFTNLLNRYVQHHPAGATETLSLLVRLQVRI